jgi:hypothetical protein
LLSGRNGPAFLLKPLGYGAHRLHKTREGVRQRIALDAVENKLPALLAGNQPGRVGAYEHTNCHACGERVISRYGYLIQEYKLTPDGACPECHVRIPGRWGAAFEGQITAHPFQPHDRTRRLHVL